MTRHLDVAGVSLHADLSGALFWEEQRLLVVSDLHLEKGSSFAMRGVLLPPYDTLATLSRLGFQRPEQATETIRGWHFGRRPAVRSARAREVLTELTPGLIAAFANIFPYSFFVAHLLVDRRVHAIAAARCC